MNRRITGFLLAIFLIAGFAQAEIPLNLEATVVMSGPGDLQCWQSPSTFGYAYLDQHSIYYKFQLSDSLRSFEIANDTISNWWDIRLIRLAQNGMHLGVVILGHGPYYSDDNSFNYSNYASIYDLNDRTFIRAKRVARGFGWRDAGFYDSSSISSWSVWPFPPQRTEYLISGSVEISGTWDISMNGYNEYQDRINIFHIADTVFWQTSSKGRIFSIYNDADTLRYAASSTYQLICYGPQPPCESRERSLICAFSLGRSSEMERNGSFTTTVAQKSTYGSHRIITATGSAFDFETMDSLWGGAFSTAYDLVTIKIDSTGDERILVLNSGRYDVYNGRTGLHLDRTTAVIGDSAYVLKQPGRADRLVTRVSNTFRIYRPADVSDQSEENANLTPTKYSLSQNYPNPFNPTTEIRFELPVAAQVELSIFNVNGQLVRTLVNERLTPGVHGARFDGGNLPSGMYLYRLASPTFTQTRKMVLLK